MAVVYDLGSGERRNWILGETPYDPALSGKLESLFALGNGYMGLRAASEERYAREIRGLYVAGLFDAFPGEVPELANLPDWLPLEIEVAGERFSCLAGTIHAYERSLDLRSGVLVRSIDWESPTGRRMKLRFERFVSMADLHTAALRLTLEPLNFEGSVSLLTGINGQVTNSGVQHLREGQLRLLPGGTIASIAPTQQSGIGVCVASTHRYVLDGHPLVVREAVRTDRRRIDLEAQIPIQRGQRLSVTKYAAVYTTRDSGITPELGAEDPLLLELAAASLERSAESGYDALFSLHAERWRSIWEEIDVDIEGSDFDQLALRFALFHLIQMTPSHDSRTSVAAKGLSGEGYKGHVFWDTEIFILPVFTFTMPDTARQLLEYRYHTLGGAREKARRGGFRGAMYPWESADSGAETTPTMGVVDIASGRYIRIWSGDIEQHISVDVPYAVWQYYRASGDERFLLDMGLEIMLETARFWASRLEWNAERSRYEITDVIGPDEYGEHVDNNAYTNYMVQWHLRNTAAVYRKLARDRPAEASVLAEKLLLTDSEILEWTEKAAKIFTNIDAATGFIHQYDGFTDKKPIDLSKYHGRVGSITRDYGWSELMGMQITKQADTVMLLYLRGENFSDEVKRLNWDYYEPRTLHDSSLSPAIHSIVASDMGEMEKAYAYFQRAARIDLGPEPSGSEAGLHAASLGGVWQSVVNGFGGVRVGREGLLHISPRLPKPWQRLSFPLAWHGKRLRITVRESQLAIESVAGAEHSLELDVQGVRHTHHGSGRLEIPLRSPEPPRSSTETVGR